MTRYIGTPLRTTVSTWAVWSPTRIAAASVCARCSERRVKNDTVKPAGLATLSVTGGGGGRTVSVVAIVALSATTVVAESNVTGWSRPAARGRKPVHQKVNHISAPPP